MNDLSDQPNKVKVLVVDDTITYRMILSQVVQSLDEIELSGTAVDGQKALEHLHRQPVDLVLLDVEMPVLNGMETLKAIIKQFPKTRVVLISGTNKSSADMTISALQAGALDFIAKPDQGSMSSNMTVLRQRLSTVVKILANRLQMKPLKSSPHTIEKASNAVPASKPESKVVQQPIREKKPFRLTRPAFQALAIGVSTGGPNALMEVIPQLPDNLDIPVFVVQHMPPVFTASLANSLDKKSSMKVKEAEHNELVVPNTVYIAPGGHHMVVRKMATQQEVRIILTQDLPVNSCRPAVDVLFNSVAQIYGNRTLSMVMTGMGQDGALGVQQIKQAGGYCLTQSAASCVVYGMPRAVDEMGLADESVELRDIPGRIKTLMQK